MYIGNKFYGKLYFAYSIHRTKEEAEDALVDYFASGIVCEAERPKIEYNQRTKRYNVMFPAS